MTKVFVYGTLLTDEPNHYLLGDSRCCGPAIADGQYYLLDTGCGYPAAVDAHIGGAPIHGELFEVDDYTLARLDRLESNGRLYRRHLRKVRLTGVDITEKAWIYIFLQPTDKFSLVPNNDWMLR